MKNFEDFKLEKRDQLFSMEIGLGGFLLSDIGVKGKWFPLEHVFRIYFHHEEDYGMELLLLLFFFTRRQKAEAIYVYHFSSLKPFNLHCLAFRRWPISTNFHKCKNKEEEDQEKI